MLYSGGRHTSTQIRAVVQEGLGQRWVWLEVGVVREIFKHFFGPVVTDFREKSREEFERMR